MPTITETTPAAAKSDKKRGSKFTLSQKAYKFSSRGGRNVKRHVEQVKRFHGIDKLTPAMSGGVAYFLSGPETSSQEGN